MRWTESLYGVAQGMLGVFYADVEQRAPTTLRPDTGESESDWAVPGRLQFPVGLDLKDCYRDFRALPVVDNACSSVSSDGLRKENSPRSINVIALRVRNDSPSNRSVLHSPGWNS